jgi:hypothetical protein
MEATKVGHIKEETNEAHDGFVLLFLKKENGFVLL